MSESKQFEDIVGYKELEDRVPDQQYAELLDTIFKKGKKIPTQLEDSAWTIFGHQLRYDLSNGFPLITERDLTKAGPAAFAELAAFVNGVRTVEDLHAWGNNWWDKFATPEKCAKRGLEPGDLGEGSYGAGFNQIQAIVDQIQEKPQLRTHVATTWVPQTNFRATGYEQKTVWVPCHGTMLHFRVIEDELHLHHTQRSADAPVGLVFNIAQYAALLLVVSKVTGYKPGEYVHTLSDVHIYERQLNDAEALIERGLTSPRPFPKLLVDVALDSAFEWGKDSFQIQEYSPHPGMRIDTPND
jgi:thymidylate synthase